MSLVKFWKPGADPRFHATGGRSGGSVGCAGPVDVGQRIDLDSAGIVVAQVTDVSRDGLTVHSLLGWWGVVHRWSVWGLGCRCLFVPCVHAFDDWCGVSGGPDGRA